MTVDRNIREQASGEIPIGRDRDISGRVTSPAGIVYCGYTDIGGGRRHSFTEGEEQVRRDTTLGFKYYVVADG